MLPIPPRHAPATQIATDRGFQVTIGRKQRRVAVWKHLQAVLIAVGVNRESKVFRLRPEPSG